MDNVNFNTYIITSDDISLKSQFKYLKKLKNYKYREELAIQIRFNKLSDKEITRFSKELKEELNDIKILINNRVDLMTKCYLDGVHFKDDNKNIEIKKYQKQGKIFLKSTHSLQSIKDAQRLTLDAITYGPIFETPSKLKYGKPNGYELIKNNDFKIPIFALGGLNLNNIAELKKYFYGVSAIRLFINEDIIKNLNKRREIWK